jgi:acetyl-CoA synthetase
MSDTPHPEAVITHPVAPRLSGKAGKAGHKEPHVGPNLAAYRAAHAETVGEGSDAWWAEVSSPLVDGYRGQR